MNTAPYYPWPGTYLTFARAGFARTAAGERVSWDWAMQPVDADGWRRAFLKALDERINAKGKTEHHAGLLLVPEGPERQALRARLAVELERVNRIDPLYVPMRRPWRKLDSNYQRGLMQDAMDVNRPRRWLRYHSLRTNEVRARFESETLDHGTYAEEPCFCRRRHS